MTGRGIRARAVLLGVGLAMCAAGLAPLGCSSDEDRLRSHLERADEYAEKGEVKEAILELRNALQLDPQNAETNFKIGKILEGEGELADALFFYREAARLDPNHSEAVLAAARLLRDEEPDEALRLIESVLEREPDNALAHVRRSELALAQRDLDTAVSEALTAVELAPDDPLVHMHMGLVRRAQILGREAAGEPVDEPMATAALSSFDRAIELARDDSDASRALRARAWAEKGQVYASWPGHDTDAAAAFRRASEEAHGDPLAEQAALGRTIQYARRTQNAELERWALERLVEVAPELDDAWTELERVVAEQEGDEAALAVYDRLLEARPREARAHALYAQALLRRGQRAEAFAHLEQAAESVDDPDRALGILARLYVDGGDTERARAVVERLEREHPKSAQTVIARATLDLAEQKAADAAERLRSLVATDADPLAYRLLALAEARLGNARAAADAADRAVKLQRDLGTRVPGDLLLLRARLRTAAGDWEGAIRDFRIGARRSGADLSDEDSVLLARALYGAGRTRAGRTRLELSLKDRKPLPLSAVIEYARREGAHDPERVRELLQQALAENPGHPQILQLLVERDVAEGKLGDARERLDAALAARPDDPALLMLRARARAAGGDLAGAEADLRRVLDLDPNALGPATLLARLLIAQGRMDEAAKELDARERAGELGLGGRLLLARLEIERGNDARARELLEKLLEERDDLPAVKNDLADLLARSGQELDRALVLAQEARRGMPNSPAPADTLGLVYLKKSLPEPALVQFGSAIDLAKAIGRDRPVYHYHRALALAELGRTEEAAREIEQALASPEDFPQADEARARLEALRQAAATKPTATP